ncbi:zinc finger BED domain-containing protein 4 isoform X2 [Teleopsis dalmanni]|uniref:zinc finger BED domain-containing protein 4 isoform X2 n=1 Tax=Teleopsis dalmanni TaxID=139649 RepID=UPI0018CEF128|nr:zinc finger BED domain-containing protein 4 isoform X2 [Teleopsis dalmanni]
MSWHKICEEYKPAVTDAGNDVQAHSDASTVDEPINEEDVVQDDAYAYLQGLNHDNDDFLLRRRAPKRKTSNIWTHYIVQEAGRAKCKYCKSSLSTAGGSQGNLHRHMRTKHSSILQLERKSSPLQQDVVDVEEAATMDVITTIASPPSSVGREEQIDNQVIKMIAKGHHSLRIVEEPEFRKLITQISHCSGYELPTRKTILQILLPKLYENVELQLKQKLLTTEAVCLTIDNWVSQDGQSYIAVKVHFINLFTNLCSGLILCTSYDETNAIESIHTYLKKVIDDWQLTNKVVAIVTENSANILAAIEKGKWQKLECFAHCLNLVVQEALKKIGATIQRVKNIFTYFDKNPEACKKLKDYQKQIGINEVKIKQDDTMRWNSTYKMLTHVVEIKEVLISSGLLQRELRLSPHNWELIEEVLAILEPFYEITIEISAEEDISLSKVVVVSNLLRTFLSERYPKNAGASDFLNCLLEEMQKHFESLDHNHLYAECTILDPRFKKRGFKNKSTFEKAAKEISKKIASCDYELPTDNTDNTDNTDVVMASTSIWSKYDETYVQVKGDEDKSVAARKELDKYINEQYLERTKDPLAWWEQHKMLYPRLYQLVLKRFCIVATSVPCSRIFLNNDRIISERKAFLKSDETSDLVFLHNNM